MQIVVKTTEKLGREIIVKVPASNVDNKVNERLKEMAKTMKISGFRQGKVPISTLKMRYGDDVRLEIIEKLLKKTFYEAIKNKNLDIAGDPKITLIESSKDKDLEYKAVVEVYPEIELKGLEEIEIEQFKSELTDDDMSNILKQVQKSNSDWEHVDRKANDEDRVIIDADGFINDVAFSEGKVREMSLILGSKDTIPGFEQGIVGAKKGDELEVKTKFPENYYVKNLAGKDVTFKVKVLDVFAPKLPELNDEFAKKLGVEGGFAKFKEKLFDHSVRQLRTMIKNKNKKIVMDKLLELNKFDLPKVSVEDEIDKLRDFAKEQFKPYTQSKSNESINLPRDYFLKNAERRVALGLLIGAIIKKFDIKPDIDRIHEAVIELSKKYSDPQKFIDLRKKDKQRAMELKNMVIEDQAIEKILEGVKLKETNICYEDLANDQKL